MAVEMNDCTILIPYYHDGPERYENLLHVLKFLDKHFTTNVIIGEQHTKQIDEQFAELQGSLPNINLRIIEVPAKTFEGHENLFWISRVVNCMSKYVKTPYLGIYGSDSLFEPQQISEAMMILRLGISKCVYPFDTPTFDVPREFHYLLKLYDYNIEKMQMFKIRQYFANKVMFGNAIFYETKTFLAVGGYNENFVSWGSEDTEIFRRYQNLGIPCSRVKGPVLHLDHPRKTNSGEQNPFRQRNKQMEEQVANMTQEETIELVKQLRDLREKNGK